MVLVMVLLVLLVLYSSSLVALGSCTQISLFVIPMITLCGWYMEKPMTMNYPHYEIILLIASVLLVSISLQGSETNWLLGSLLLTMYVLVAIAFWFETLTNYVE